MSGEGEHGPTAVQVQGLVEGTRVATPAGWLPVEHLRVGDAVLTVDGPPQPLRLVRRNRIWTAVWPDALLPLVVPPGALDNRDALVLLSGQHVLLETDLAESQCGEPFALVPAAALDGFRGIHRLARPVRTGAVLLEFAEDELIYAAGAALLRCGGSPSAGDSFRALLERAQRGRAPALSMEQATHLVACLVAEAAGADLRSLSLQAARARGANRP